MKALAALLLLALSVEASASGVVDETKDSKRFGTRKACEKALRKLHSAAAARLAAAPAEERERIRLETPYRDDDDRLAYFQVVDRTIHLPDMAMPMSEGDEYSCRGRTLEHRFYVEGGSYVFLPPPAPPTEQPPAESPQS